MANFTSYSNALVLMTALCNKLRELNEAYVFKGSVAFANLPSTLTEDMCGYTYNVTDDFTTDNRFIEGAGKSYSAGSNVVVANMTTTTYDEVTPAGTENPSEEGWYEFDGSAYVLTQDTELQAGKTYYEQVVTPSYKFDVIGNFIDVESIMGSISSVAAMITDATFSPSSAYSIGDIVIYENSLYQFKAAHTADTAWDATEVDEITIEGQLAAKANTADLGTAATKNMDSSLNDTSENPVQNKVLYSKFLDIDANLAAIRVMMNARLYGFRISKTDSNPNTRVEYLYDAVGKTPAAMNTSTGVFNYGSWGNDWFVTRNKPCALRFDGSVDYYLDPNDYTKKEDGTDSDLYVLLTSEPADWSSGYKNYFTKVDNSFVKVTGDTTPSFTSDTYYSNRAYAGNFEAQIPLSYVKRWEDDAWRYVAISDKQVTPDFKADAHKDENGTVHDYFYAPMFKGCIVDSKLRSIAGVIPQGNTTGSQENTAATTCGAGWQLWDWSKHELISDLLILMSKSTDSQTSFGQGDTNTYDASDTVTYGKLPTGTSGSGQFWGGTDKQHVKVFHIEDFWGNRWERCLGLNLVNNIYVYKLVRPYALDTDGTYINSGLEAPAEGWQTASYIGDFGRLPKTTGGTSSTFDCDYFYKNTSGTRLALFGGDCNSGLGCGSRCVRLTYGSSPSYWLVGGSPCYLGTSA